MNSPASPLTVAIACGGTGGHLLPGRAVAQALEAAGVVPRLLVSRKKVDLQLVRDLPPERVTALPAVAGGRRRGIACGWGLLQSLRQCRRTFRRWRPAAVLSMGGFASAAPVLMGRWHGARVFLHEANAVAGRANRRLAWLAREAFVHFPSAAADLPTRHTRVVGMPVRDCFHPRPAAECREALGLDPLRPTLLIMGGSQGAVFLNQAARETLPLLLRREPRLQCIHLVGATDDVEKTRAAYRARQCPARVEAFLAETHLAMSAADVAVSRAGASSLAELAATRLPAVLVPYPHAADNHQHHNARRFSESGAARVLPQAEATPERLAAEILALLTRPAARDAMRDALTRRHHPHAASVVARHILNAIGGGRLAVTALPPAWAQPETRF
jgi:UDP-N-acetylglucosamine--N-acetylmuramyl-(pentapeptide) pyrophosphoryl-undecaprenol N-acetylglucosamine transferase